MKRHALCQTEKEAWTAPCIPHSWVRPALEQTVRMSLVRSPTRTGLADQPPAAGPSPSAPQQRDMGTVNREVRLARGGEGCWGFGDRVLGVGYSK